jgi:hypothetical protein
MRRKIFAVLLASITAFYLTAFFLYTALLVIGQSEGIEEFYDLLKFIPVGTLALMVYGIPLLFLSALCAAVLNAVGLEAKSVLILSGASLGLLFIAALLSFSLPLDQESSVLLAVAPLSGATCGWIYWRIALRATLTLDHMRTSPEHHQ